jgi:predicted nucleotidyltransferase
MLMTHVFGLDARRATHDVDFAIALESWEQFQTLKTALVASGAFAPATDKIHLLLYQPAEHSNAFPLDLIPFGGLEQEAHRIAWPRHDRRHECHGLCRSAGVGNRRGCR